MSPRSTATSEIGSDLGVIYMIVGSLSLRIRFQALLIAVVAIDHFSEDGCQHTLT